MLVFKNTLFTINRCIYHIQRYDCKRNLSYSTIRNTKNQQEKFGLDIKHEEASQRNTKKLLKVAMLGLPNVGKSTLVNKLIQRSVCPTSSKVHTTMHKTKAVLTEGNTQIIFIDTPGLTTPMEMKSYKLAETFKEDPETSVKEADVIGIIQDVTNIYTRHKIDNLIINYLNERREDAQLLLIFNKVDRLKEKMVLLELTRSLSNDKKYPKFDDIFMVSALVGDGIDDLRNYLIDSAKEQEWAYNQDLYMDQSIDKLIQETVRAQLMDILPSEMPYSVKILVEHFDFGEDGSLSTLVRLICPKQRYVRSLLKQKGHKTKCLAFYIEKELRHALRTNVFVRLNVTLAQDQESQ